MIVQPKSNPSPTHVQPEFNLLGSLYIIVSF